MFLREKATAFAAAGRARMRGVAGRVGPDVVIRRQHGQVVTASGVQIRRGCRIAVVGAPNAPATLTLGEGVIIGGLTRINVTRSVTIGDHTEISWLVQVMDTDFHRIAELDGTVRPHQAPVTIGAHVLIGTGVIITKGVTIGDGAVIGAGSVITGDVKAGTMVAGNPARVIREIGGWA